MRKITKILASAGIAAGIGAVLIPGATHAIGVSGNVDLKVNVLPGISMKIVGNYDTNEECTVTSCSHFGLVGPSQFGTASSEVTVYTNSTTGYNLTVKAVDSPDFSDGDGHTLPAGTLTGATGGQGLWSFKTDRLIADWTAMSLEETMLKKTTEYQSGGDITNVTYGVSAADTQVAGKYKVTLLYTATVNDAEYDGSDEWKNDCASAGDTCTNTEGVSFAKLADGNLWTTEEQARTPDNIDTCASGSHLPTALEYYNLLLAYGGTPLNEYSPYNISLTSAELAADVQWTGGPVYWSSTPYDGAYAWALFHSGNYFHLEPMDDVGISWSKICVAE